MYRYEFTSVARHQIKKLSPEIQQMIIKKLDYFVSTQKPLFFATKLTDFSLGQYRFRIGDWRVVFDVIEEVLVIHKIGHRRDVYKKAL